MALILLTMGRAVLLGKASTWKLNGQIQMTVQNGMRMKIKTFMIRRVVKLIPEQITGMVLHVQEPPVEHPVEAGGDPPVEPPVEAGRDHPVGLDKENLGYKHPVG